MNSTIKTKNNCNIYIPRTVYSLYMILSKSKSVKEDNFIIINNFNLEKIPSDLIDLLKKKFSIIFVNKNYLFTFSLSYFCYKLWIILYSLIIN